MIAVEQQTGLAMLTMDDGRVNALDLEALTELTASLREIRAPVVITGTGKAFSAGVDLRRIVNDGDDYVRDFLAALSDAFLTVFTHPYPVIAAVNGHAIAGGCIIALAADYRLMSAGTIGVTEVAVGVPFPVAALEICRYALGPAVSAAALHAEAVPASQAKAAGFAHELTSPGDLLARARDVARSLGAHPPGAYQLTKQQLQRPTLQAIAEQAEHDAAVVDLWRAPETRERLTRFLESLNEAASLPSAHPSPPARRSSPR
jgi:enoyl-CoA hydratase